MGTCRHCGPTPRAIRARGLCNHCYVVPGVKERYPTLWPTGRRKTPDSGAGNGPAAAGTSTPIGSDARIAILAARAEVKMELHHKDDSADRCPEKMQMKAEQRKGKG